MTARSEAPPVAAPAAVRIWSRNYSLFILGLVVSNIGTWAQRVAQSWLVLDISGGSGTALGITTGLQFLPVLLFGAWGGGVVDRLPRPVATIASGAPERPSCWSRRLAARGCVPESTLKYGVAILPARSVRPGSSRGWASSAKAAS